MKKILVPTDFSPNAETALYFAMGMAKQHGSMLILLNVIETPSYDDPSEEILNEVKIEKFAAGERLKLLSQQIDYAGDIKYECLVELEENAVKGIANISKKTEADLIVMGTKGEKGAADFVFGTITSGVIEDAQCPVLAVPEGTRLDRPIKKMTYATDFLQSDLGAIKTAVVLATAWNASLNIVHVYEEGVSVVEPEQDVEKLGKFIKLATQKINYERMSFELLTGDDVESRLLEYTNSSKTDILLLSTKHRNYFGRLLNTSLTQNLARLASVPLIAFHHHKEKPAFKV
ncbi:universal stress protein [Aurantibacillus circumpalustris]|uniref:universal stress protein n=1 Tax=Aurantibacillus circumpalustris TaxID=3036359 RepID=UPI00295C173D|nr:universal stress protein [Aurantibacillus circumpalustris]